MTTDIVDSYLQEVRTSIGSNVATDERSHYPALKTLLNDVGRLMSPKVRAEADPAGIGGGFPDLAILETNSKVLVLPVEAKPPSWPIQRILDQPKTSAYAHSFGGGRVLVTNIHTFALAEVDATGDLQVILQQQVCDPADIANSSSPTTATDAEIVSLVEVGCELRATISAPRDVAHHLAEHAGAMREQILAAGDPADLLAPIWDLFESGLGAELDDEFFVPTVVQTLVYGLFAGWLASSDDPTEFDWQSASYQVDVPLFADVLHASLRPYLIRRCNLFPRLAAVAGVLQRVDRERFTSAFSDGAIEYFYEPFLAAFDEDLRNRLGVWYTPREVAEFQVRACDYELRTRLGLADGLADESVIILDPAVGTGTYLSAVYKFIYLRHRANGEQKSVAASRAKEAALSRVIGFELLPAAFIVCHLSLNRVLKKLGAPLDDHERLSVYLTNSLTGWDPAHDHPTSTLFPELEEELSEARRIKQNEPVMVILGNPPYEGYSSAESPEEQALIEPWISPLWPKWGVRKHRLNDLYARFWAASIRRVELTGRGVVSFITNSKWLTGRSYPEMRADFVDSFDHLQIVNLNGAVHDRTDPKDQSIFTTNVADGIKVGTAIVTATRLPDIGEAAASVHSLDLTGPADLKRIELKRRRHNPAAGSNPLAPTEESKWRFSPHAGTEFPNIEDYFVINDKDESFFSGVQPGRGGVSTDHDRASLTDRMRDYFDKDLTFDDLADRHPDLAKGQSGFNPKDSRRKLLGRANTTEEGGFEERRLRRFLFRPMEARWLYWEPDHKFLTRPRPTMIPFWALDGQKALVAPQTRRRLGAAQPIVATQVVCNEAVDPNARVLPMLRPDDLGAAGGTNAAAAKTAIAPEWITAARAVGVAGSDDEVGESLFYALAGIGASPAWLETQELESDELPEIPLPGTASGIEKAAQVGRQYANLVDPDVDVPGVTTGAIRQELRGIGTPDTPSGDAILTQGSHGRNGGDYRDGAIFWDDENAWRNVSPAVWAFNLGGFPVLSKWLSYRVGTTLSQSDREALMHLVRRITAISQLGAEADAVFAQTRTAPLVV